MWEVVESSGSSDDLFYFRNVALMRTWAMFHAPGHTAS